jgi:hypothetical protein
MERLDEKLMESFFLCIVAPLLGAAPLLVPTPLNAIARLVFALAFSVSAFVLSVTRLFRQLNELRDCRLGFFGERAVAEEINQLMRDGCRVFHDVPMEPYGNIDHVIIAPTGVYAVETKTRRKRKAKPGKRNHEVEYDGKVLRFPQGIDSSGLDQAKQQAHRLRVLLSKAVGEPVKVTAILTLPGWFVSSTVKDGLKVVNPKQIRHVVLDDKPTKLSNSFMERISHQLDQRTRDVEI